MTKLSLAVRVAAGSIVALSVIHIVFWAWLALAARSADSSEFHFGYVFPVLCVFSAAGFPGIVVGAGLFRPQNWARVAALVISVLVGCFCALSVLALLIVSFGGLSLGLGVEIPQKSDLLRVAVIYFLIFAVAVWWLVVFSRKSVAAQFSSSNGAKLEDARKKPACPPPIALLAWLIIISSALSAISWPLIFGRIPAMLFTRVYPIQTSQWIWAANILLFLLCGVGLLKLQRWSYDSTILLHVFWTVSLFFSRLSPGYPGYIRQCLLALEFPSTINDPTAFVFPYWLTAIVSVVPTFLLVVGLFYYRRGFLQAVQNSRHPSS